MSEQSLDRRYRPVNSETIAGNDILKRNLMKGLEVGKISQTIGFYGEKGTGKSTMSRWLAKSLLCENPQHGEACNKCDTCIEINKSFLERGVSPTELGIYEFDVTTFNTVDDVKKIVAQMRKETFRGVKRIYILDEIQRASPQAQESLLKVSEEPLEGVYVFMNTTNPEKLNEALKSRFVMYKVRKPTLMQMANYLKMVCDKEGFRANITGLKAIVRYSGGVPRISMKTLEDLAKFGEPITLNFVEENLGILSTDLVKTFVQNCLQGKLHLVLEMLDQMDEEGQDLSEIVEGVGNLASQGLYVKAGTRLEDVSVAEFRNLNNYFEPFEQEQLMSLVKVARNYAGMRLKNDYLFMAFVIDVMNVLKEREHEKDISEGQAYGRYMKVTEEVQNVDRKEQDFNEKDVDMLALRELFGEDQVVVVGDSIPEEFLAESELDASVSDDLEGDSESD